ncbi:hypothetical protein Trydic_g9500 [Trypoxylus dichotomus]
MVYRSVEESGCYPPDEVHQWLHSGVFVGGGVPYELGCVEGPAQCPVLERFQFPDVHGRSGFPHGAYVDYGGPKGSFVYPNLKRGI